MKRLFFILTIAIFCMGLVYTSGNYKTVTTESYGKNLSTAITSIGTTTVTLTSASTVTLSANVVIPANVNYKPQHGTLISCGSYTIGINGPFEAGNYQVFDSTCGGGDVTFGAGTVNEVTPKWWGAKIDNSTNDSDAWNSAFLSAPATPSNEAGFTIIVPFGISKVTTTAIDVPGNRTYMVKGYGFGSSIHAVGIDAFTISGEGNTGTIFKDFLIYGDNTASKSAFNCTQSNDAYIQAKIRWENLRIIAFKIAWNVPNTQLCSFHHNKVDFTATGGSVFYINTSGGYGSSNSNRVTELNATGADAQVFNFTLTAGQNRAANWTLRDSDIQFSGTTIPITIKDFNYTIDNNEFENSTADNLILLTADDSFTAYFASITNNILIGGGAGGNPKILSTTTGAQYPYYATIIGNDAGASSTLLLTITHGRSFTVLSNQGTISGIGEGYHFIASNTQQLSFEGGFQSGPVGNYIGFAASKPTTTVGYQTGDRYLNRAVSVGQPKGWIYTSATATWNSEGDL